MPVASILNEVKNEFDQIMRECSNLERKAVLFEKEQNEEIRDSHAFAMSVITHGICNSIDRTVGNILEYLDGSISVGADLHSAMQSARMHRPKTGQPGTIICENTARALNDLKEYNIFGGIYWSGLDMEEILYRAKQTLKVAATVMREVNAFMKTLEPPPSTGRV